MIITAIFIIALIIVLLFAIFNNKNKLKLVQFKIDNYSKLLQKFFLDTKYEPDNYFVPGFFPDIKNSDGNNAKKEYIFAPMFRDYTICKGSDYLKGKTKNGILFKYCYIDLKGQTKKSLLASIAATLLSRRMFYYFNFQTTLFKGSVFNFEHNKKLNEELRICSKTINYKSSFIDSDLNKIESDSLLFNKSFNTYCNNTEQAFYILTPHFMEKLISMENSLGSFVMSAYQNHISFAIPNLNLFQAPNNFSKKEIESTINRINHNIQQFSETIFSLNLIEKNNFDYEKINNKDNEKNIFYENKNIINIENNISIKNSDKHIKILSSILIIILILIYIYIMFFNNC